MTHTSTSDGDLGSATLPELLDRVVDLGDGRLPPQRLAHVAELRDRAQHRLARGDALTVVAIVGGTGVGKSALVNRLFDVEVVPTGVRRPTTDHPVAVRRARDEPTSRLLDWLDIADRREVDVGQPEGLMVVDLPDHDSVVVAHRATAERLVSRVDAVVVVVDPLKYARADLHHGPLAGLVEHASLVTIVLNRIDELDATDVDRCLADVSAQLAVAGHQDVEVVPTSAVTGYGVDELRTRLTALAATRTAAERRLLADAAALASDLDACLPDLLEVDAQHDPVARSADPGAQADVAASLVQLTGGERRCAAAELAYRSEAHHATRSYASRLVRRLVAMTRRATHRRDPTPAAGGGRRDPTPAAGGGHRDTDPTPSATPVAPAIATVLAHRAGLDRTTAVTHTRLASLIEDQSAWLTPRLIGAVDAQEPRPDRRAWWSAMSLANTLTEATALTGLVWLVLLRAADWLALPDLPLPALSVPWLTGRLSLPAALLVGGAALRLAGGGLTRWSRRIGAHRHRTRLRRRIIAGQREALERVDATLREQRCRDLKLRAILRRLRDAGTGRRGAAAPP